MAYLLGWRECYTWLSVQLLPLVLYRYLFPAHHQLDWFFPLYVATSLVTLSIGPLQVVFASLLAAPELRERRGWFRWYTLMSLLFFTAMKNHWARVAHLRHLSGDRVWTVTPRSSTGGHS